MIRRSMVARGRRGLGRRSFRSILLVALCAVSIVPLICLSFVSYARIGSVMQSSIDDLIDNNLAMAARNLDVVLGSYEDILYQLYTSDEVVELAASIDAGDQTALHRNQLMRTLRATSYFKPNIQGVTVLLPGGGNVYYDKLTGKATQLSWLEQYPMSPAAIYEAVSADNETHYLPTAFTGHINNEDEYVFHIAHRIINYRNIYKQCGVVILTLDASMLLDTISYASSGEQSGENYLLDAHGVVLAAARKEMQGDTLPDVEKTLLDTAEPGLSLYRYTDPQNGREIVRLLDASAARRSIAASQAWFLLGLLGTSVVLLLTILVITRRMTASIRAVVTAMERAGGGDMQARIALPESTPKEIARIGEDFNRMMGELGDMMDEVRRANDRQRQAEITAVEAQINPHFLYNTLDTINWMAIDQEQYAISNSISALGGILRYAIDRSNKPVRLREELAWLNQYVFLQQTRLKGGFTFESDVDERCLDCLVYKLLLQPFVENAIIHGFEGATGPCRITLRAAPEGDRMDIVIADNGKGMTEAELAACFEEGREAKDERGHIGVRNVLTRLRMYYGDRAEVRMESTPGEGTVVRVWLPIERRDAASES